MKTIQLQYNAYNTYKNITSVQKLTNQGTCGSPGMKYIRM